MILTVLFLSQLSGLAHAGNFQSGDAKSDRVQIVLSTFSMTTSANTVRLSTFDVTSAQVTTRSQLVYTVPNNRRLRLTAARVVYAPSGQYATQTVSSTTITMLNGGGASTSPVLDTMMIFYTSGTPITPCFTEWPEGVEISSTTPLSIAHSDKDANYIINFSYYGYTY